MSREIRGSRRRGLVGGFAPGLLRPRPRLADPGDAMRLRGAAVPPTRVQVAIGGLAVAVLLAGATLAPAVVHHLVFLLFLATALTRLIAGLMQVRSTDTEALPDEALPPYTVIAPLYREADIAPQLVDALCALDYPADRLQIIVVLESDDHETRDALSALALPAFIQVLAAPPGYPRTKPRACNVALEQATGTLVTIYDAEDRPDPGQLREAASRFAVAPARLACLQAPMRIDPDGRVLPAQFALEYATQFEVLLPALARLGAPFPLGGTSNHFRGIR